MLMRRDVEMDWEGDSIKTPRQALHLMWIGLSTSSLSSSPLTFVWSFPVTSFVLPSLHQPQKVRRKSWKFLEAPQKHFKLIEIGGYNIISCSFNVFGFQSVDN